MAQPETAGWRGKFAGLALILAILSVAWFAVAALGTKYGLWSWQFGLGTLTVGLGPAVAFGALGLSVLALLIGVLKAPRKRPVMLAIGAILISGYVAGRLVGFGSVAQSLPPIHDVQTDWEDPISFSETLMAAREADGALNPVKPDPVIPETADSRWPGLGGRRVAEVQQEAEYDPARDAEPEDAPYPRLDTITVPGTLGNVARLCEALMREEGWEIVTASNVTAGTLEAQIEATATTGWFGFRDDVAVRLRAVDDGVEVDMRSISRVGLSDLGANSRRVAGFLRTLERQAETAARREREQVG